MACAVLPATFAILALSHQACGLGASALIHQPGLEAEPGARTGASGPGVARSDSRGCTGRGCTEALMQFSQTMIAFPISKKPSGRLGPLPMFPGNMKMLGRGFCWRRGRAHRAVKWWLLRAGWRLPDLKAKAQPQTPGMHGAGELVAEFQLGWFVPHSPAYFQASTKFILCFWS